MARDGGETVGAVEHGFAVLEELYRSNGARIADLSRRLDLSKSTIHSHLTTLHRMGYVEKRGQVYDLGMGFLTFGGYVRDNHRLYQIAREGADELADTTGELAAVSTELGGHILYLYQVHGADAMSLDSHVGSQLPMHCTATGKAMLAALPEERVAEIVDSHGLAAVTDNTITDRDALDKELRTIADRGISFDREERIEGMRGVAASIVHGEEDIVLGAIGVTGPTTRMSGERYEADIPELLSRIARMVEINATYA